MSSFYRTMNENFNFFAVEYDLGDEKFVKIVGFNSNDSEDKFFTAVAKAICFEDCEPTNVLEIYWHGERVWYAGWEPGMLFRFCNMEKKTVWEGRFPEWDH